MNHIRGLENYVTTPVEKALDLSCLPSLDDIDFELQQRYAEEGKKSLAQHTKNIWPIIEPGTPLIWNWHIDLICEYLEAVSLGQIQRLLINMPPRYMKSILISVAWPTWEWIDRPWERYIFSSYAQSLSTKHSIDRRMVIQSDWYQNYYGSSFRLTDDQNTKTIFENNHRGHMIATSVGGTLTGKGGSRLAMDDPHNPMEALSDAKRQNAIEYFDLTFSTRLDNPKTDAMVVVMQRLHQKDLSGHLLARGGWTHLKIPATCEKKTFIVAPLSGISFTREAGDILWPEREDKKELDQKKLDLGSFGHASQYQQEPAPSEGNLIKKVWFNFFNIAPRFERMLQSWDCNFKNSQESDYVCGEIWGAHLNRYYLIDMFKKKVGIVGTLKAINHFSSKYPEAVKKLVENKANGPAVIDLFGEILDGLIAVEPQGGKEARVAACSPSIEAGQVYLPCIGDPTEWNSTPINNRTFEMFDAIMKPLWVEDFIKSCITFPKAEHDDDVDAATQAIIDMRKTLSPAEAAAQIAIGTSLDLDLDFGDFDD